MNIILPIKQLTLKLINDSFIKVHTMMQCFVYENALYINRVLPRNLSGYKQRGKIMQKPLRQEQYFLNPNIWRDVVE